MTVGNKVPRTNPLVNCPEIAETAFISANAHATPERIRAHSSVAGGNRNPRTLWLARNANGGTKTGEPGHRHGEAGCRDASQEPSLTGHVAAMGDLHVYKSIGAAQPKV